ncbi:MAG: hypothetical protein ACE5EG_05340 [Thermoanaerobaculia bacterium]
MSAEPDPPGPIDCLQRGLRSLRANWQLVPVVVIQTLLTTGLIVAGLLVLFAALGISVVAWLRSLGPDWPQQLIDDLVLALEATPPPLLPLVLPLIGATLLWTLAFGLYCYLQGGAVGILAEGETAAGGGLPGWRSFRRFSLAAFDLQGRRLFWRYFWFNHLLGAVILVWTTLLLALLVLAVDMATGRQPTLGVAVGCTGLAPLGLLLVAIGLWSILATVEVARPGAGVWAASSRALGTLRRRFGAVLVISLLAMVAWLAGGAVLTPIRWTMAIAAGDHLSVWLTARGVLLAFESLIDGAVVVALVATLAALVGLRPAAATEAG